VGNGERKVCIVQVLKRSRVMIERFFSRESAPEEACGNNWLDLLAGGLCGSGSWDWPFACFLARAGTLPFCFYALAGTLWIIPVGLMLPWMHRDARKP